MSQFSLQSQVLWATSLGFLSHWFYFSHGEHHMLAPVYGCLFIAVLPSLYLLELQVQENALTALHVEVKVLTAYLASLFFSMSLYRMFFHRLRGFSGPAGASLSKIWHVWKVRSSKNHLVMDKLFHEYGKFVRTGPEEITIFDPEALLAMNGPGTNCNKADWSPLLCWAEIDCEEYLASHCTPRIQVHSEIWPGRRWITSCERYGG